jgi:hypothetical protein
MLNNFYILPSVQHPIIEPFLNCVMVSDGTCDRPDGFDFEKDGSLVADLLESGDLKHGQSLFYVRHEGYYEIVFNDCGIIMCLVPWTHSKGATINPPPPPLPAAAELSVLSSENELKFFERASGEVVLKLYLEPYSPPAPGWTREKRDELAAELCRRWSVMEKLLEIEMPQGEPIASQVEWGHRALGVLTEGGYILKREGE